ncbi:MAG: hypothetical protein HYS12_29435 [Planctomycetes bacterium]|nr:hypothetical protein [Planctomycetota bacterium]
MLYPFLAVFWLFTGAFVFYFIERDRPRNGFLPYPLTTLTLVFAFYNVIRWWASRLTGGRAGGMPRRDWVRPPLRRPGDDVITPDPTFNFTDEPVPKANEAPPVIPPAPGANGSPGAEKK